MTGPKLGRAAIGVGVDGTGTGALWALRDFRSGGPGATDTLSCARLVSGSGGVRVSGFAVIVRSAEGVGLGGSAKSEGSLHWLDADVDAAREIPRVLKGDGAPGVLGSEKETRVTSAGTCVLPGEVCDSICPVAVRPGDKPELEGSTDREGLLQANVDVDLAAGAARDPPGGLECSAGLPCVLLGSENATRMPSPDVERCGCTGAEGLIDS